MRSETSALRNPPGVFAGSGGSVESTCPCSISKDRFLLAFIPARPCDSICAKNQMTTGKTKAFDEKEFRRVLGQFATGVAVVTTRAKDGTPAGVTVNSFTSVSLNPPLVLWCLARSSQNLSAFRKASHFAVNILAAGQHALSRKFAESVPNKFDGVDCAEGKAGVPLLRGVIARLVCRKVRRFDGGDHDIFLGRVEEYARADGKPLVFHSGRYHIVTHHPDLRE